VTHGSIKIVKEPGNRAVALGGANDGIKSIKNVVSALRGFTFMAIVCQYHAAPQRVDKRKQKATKERKELGVEACLSRTWNPVQNVPPLQEQKHQPIKSGFRD
jgi:hypothetical protein